jgi:hypothetical protein
MRATSDSGFADTPAVCRTSILPEIGDSARHSNRRTKSTDAPSFATTTLGMAGGIGLAQTVLVHTDFASGPAVAALKAPASSRWSPSAAPSRIGPTKPRRKADKP